MNKVIATDLDGTLFYPKKKVRMIPKRNIEFLRKFIDNGGNVAIVTGRNMPFTLKVISLINRRVDVIGCNGAFIYVDNKIVSEKFVPNDKAQSVLEKLSNLFGCSHYTLLSKDQSLVIAGKKLNWVRNLGYKALYFTQGVYKEKYVASNEIFNHELKHGKIYKLMLYFGLGKKGHDRACEANKYIREHYNEEIEGAWSGQFIELTAKNVNKAEGLKHYCEILGLKNDDVQVVGDSGNDISMFNAFKNSFCMDHASTKVKKYASNTVKRVADLENFVFDKKEKD